MPNERLQRDAAWAQRLHDPATAGLPLAEFATVVWSQTDTPRCLTPAQLLDLAPAENSSALVGAGVHGVGDVHGGRLSQCPRVGCRSPRHDDRPCCFDWLTWA
ncbi:hypothetical protein ACWD62_40865, partial [Streptomyces sp. NPDC005146]